MNLRNWKKPELYYCSNCQKEMIGSLSYGHFGEPIETLPPGWLRYKNDFACCQVCADERDIAVAKHDAL